MLITCAECGLNVSDKALSCPHCGYPLKETQVKRTYTKRNKRKRLPNGFGQISEIKGRNLRKPFRAMVTVGKNENGRPIVKPLKPESFFETYNDAYAALVEYQRNPYDLGTANMTVKELYEKWTEYYFATLKNKSASRNIESAWAYSSTVHNMAVRDLRARHIKGCIDNGSRIINGQIKYASADTKSRIKSMFNLMLDYAVEYEIVERNYARTFNLSDDIVDEMEKSRRQHISFTEKEMQILWDNIDKVQYVDVVLFQCYSGWRPQEIGLLKISDVDLEKGIITGGMKTDAGIDRVVPIHDRIRFIVEKKYKEAQELGSAYLINCFDDTSHKDSIKMTYDRYAYRFEKIRDRLKLNPEHRAHDGRKTFSTMAAKYKMDKYAVKYIIGHQIDDLTERVYTDRDVSWLMEEMKKIK